MKHATVWMNLENMLNENQEQATQKKTCPQRPQVHLNDMSIIGKYMETERLVVL